MYALAAFDVCFDISVADTAAATNRLRARGFPFLIISLSGDNVDVDAVQLLEAGVDMALRKPITVGLLETVGPMSPRGKRLVEGLATIGLPTKVATTI